MSKTNQQLAPGKQRLIFSLLDTPAFGGAEQYLFGHLQYLRNQGYAVYLATNNQSVRAELEKRLAQDEKLSRQHGQPSFFLENLPYRLDAIGNWKGLIKYFLSVPHSLWWLITTLIRLRRQYRVTCLLAGFCDRLTFSPLIKKLGFPLIWIDIAPLEPLFPRLWGFPKLLYQWAKNSPDHIVCTSKWTLDSIHRTAGIPREKLTLVYPGIVPWTEAQVATFRKQGKSEFMRRKLQGSTVIGYVGRLASENEVHLVIKAFAALFRMKKTQSAKKMPPLKLLIIGDGPNRGAYEMLAKRLQVDDRICFTGFIDEKTKYALLSCVDIFTFTRAWDLDGFGITTIEALALGVAAITSDFGPQREVIRHGIDGLHFAPHSWFDLAKHIAGLVASPRLRNALAHSGYQRVREFDEQGLFAKMHRVITQFGC